MGALSGAGDDACMSWVIFTADHVKARFSTRELETYEDTARGEYDEAGETEIPEGAPLRMPEIVKQVCNRFRFAILSNPNVSALGPDGTLPEGLVFSAAVIARDSLIALPPSEEGVTNPRQKEHDAAEAELRAIRSMSAAAFAVDSPPAPASPLFGGDPLLQF